MTNIPTTIAPEEPGAPSFECIGAALVRAERESETVNRTDTDGWRVSVALSVGLPRPRDPRGGNAPSAAVSVVRADKGHAYGSLPARPSLATPRGHKHAQAARQGAVPHLTPAQSTRLVRFRTRDCSGPAAAAVSLLYDQRRS
jgi:hypothetical protein